MKLSMELSREIETILSMAKTIDDCEIVFDAITNLANDTSLATRNPRLFAMILSDIAYRGKVAVEEQKEKLND